MKSRSEIQEFLESARTQGASIFIGGLTRRCLNSCLHPPKSHKSPELFHRSAANTQSAVRGGAPYDSTPTLEPPHTASAPSSTCPPTASATWCSTADRPWCSARLPGLSSGCSRTAPATPYVSSILAACISILPAD